MNGELLIQTDVIGKVVDNAMDVSPFTSTVYGFLILLLLVGNFIIYRLYINERKITKELSEKGLEVAALVGKLQVMVENQKDIPTALALVRDRVELTHQLIVKLLKID
jgi:hypothetical protein